MNGTDRSTEDRIVQLEVLSLFNNDLEGRTQHHFLTSLKIASIEYSCDLQNSLMSTSW
jgi:hypothetical protein